MDDKHTLTLAGVSKRYANGPVPVTALDRISVEFETGQLVAVHGKSGSGKSTLLNMLTGIDHPNEGVVSFDGRPLPSNNESALARWRGRHVGIVFQFFQLVPTLTALENVTLPMDFVEVVARGRRESRARELLAAMGLEDHAHRFPAQLSGGEQQRVAIARAMANDPPVLVADEPTGNLDSRTAEAVAALLRTVARQGKMVIVVTHDEAMATSFDRIIRLSDGRIVADVRPHEPRGMDRTSAPGHRQAPVPEQAARRIGS